MSVVLLIAFIINLGAINCVVLVIRTGMIVYEGNNLVRNYWQSLMNLC